MILFFKEDTGVIAWATLSSINSNKQFYYLARLTPLKFSLKMQSNQEVAKRHFGCLVYHHLTGYRRTP